MRMIIYENIGKLEDLKRAAAYNKFKRDELKLMSFTLGKQIDSDEKHNINHIISQFKKTNATYFCVTDDMIHTDIPLGEHDLGKNVKLKKTWRHDSYIMVATETKYSLGLFFLKKRSSLNGLYVRNGEEFIHYKKKKNILNYYYEKDWIATTSMVPFPVTSYRSTSFMEDVHTTLSHIEKISNTDLIISNLRVIRKYIKNYNWKNKKEIVDAIKKYSKLK